MKHTKVTPDGTVRCPKCGGTSMALKRTLKGKIGVGLLSPKRAHCLGCGANLKMG